MTTAPAWQIRRLEQADAPAYQVARLAALQLHPEAFGSDYAEEAAYSLGDFARLLSPPPGATLGAFVGDAIVGIAGVHVQPKLKQRHKGYIYGVYVDAAYRRAGLARALIAAIIEQARREKLRLLQLSVTASNDAARRLYLEFGFRTYGVEHRALLVNGVYYDEELMEMNLD
jgi:ribosomal protein S18 acetylase RimI-like enzyme